MARRKKTDESGENIGTVFPDIGTATAEGSEPAPFTLREPPPPAPPEPKETSARISLPLTAQGTIDWSSMRGATREKLQAAVASDPEAPANLGLLDTGSSPGPGLFGDASIRALYGILGGIEAQVIRRSLPTLPPAQVEKVCAYSADELDILTPPTVAVANKHIGKAAMKWREEMDLALCLIYVHHQKFQALRTMAERQQQQGADFPNRPGPRPIHDTHPLESEAM